MSEAVLPFLYDKIGSGYGQHRHPDKRIAAVLHTVLGDAVSVVNVGAGSGAYEPTDRHVIAVEPSAIMSALRGPNTAPAVRARAEALPFDDQSVDAVLAILTIHHWADQARGLMECARIARTRVIVLTWDPASEGFWLVRDYLPAFLELDRIQFPSMETLCAALGPRARPEVRPVPIPHDCTDGFLGAYWCRPAAYLDPAVQAGISSFTRQSAADIRDTNNGLMRLAADLASGAWERRHGSLRGHKTLDVGYRLIVAHLDR